MKLWSDERRTVAGVTGLLLAHPCAFGSGELKIIIDMKIQKSVTFNGCSIYLLKNPCLIVFVGFDSLHPINNLSVKRRRVFLG